MGQSHGSVSLTRMAAILRTGKFLRLFSGAARNLASGQTKTDDNPLGIQNGLFFDKSFSGLAGGQLSSLQNILPYLGVSDSGHAEDRFPTRLSASTNRSLGRVSKEEVELMVEEIEGTDSGVKSGTMGLLSSQALLTIRLCGVLMDQELPSTRGELVSKIWGLIESKNIHISAMHYNALLRVHLENNHHFCPEKVLEDMKEKSVDPDKETFQCLISRYCQDGNIEGASKMLQMMKTSGLKVNENVFNSLIMGHGEAGDLARAHGMLKVMNNWGLTPSIETFLTLACAYAKHGDWMGVERVVSEAEAEGMSWGDGEFLEVMYALCEGGHQEHVGKVLKLTHPESDEFGEMASHVLVRLVNGGHDDVAYNFVQYTVANTCEEMGKALCEDYLGQLVHLNRPVTKLLWIVNDMGEKKVLSGGLDFLVQISLQHKNQVLSQKLIEILLGEGGMLSEEQYSSLLNLALQSKGEENLLNCLAIGSKLKFITADCLKKQIFPKLENWPELVIANLEEVGLDRSLTTTPMIEWLVGQGKTEAASVVAGIFSEHVDHKLKFLTAASKSVNLECNHFSEETAISVVQPLKNENRKSSNINVLSQQDLESLLTREENADERAEIYMKLLELYSNAGAMNQAIELSKMLKKDSKIQNLPQFYESLGNMMESHFNHQQAIVYQTVPSHFAPPMSYQVVQVPVMHSGQYFPGVYPAWSPHPIPQYNSSLYSAEPSVPQTPEPEIYPSAEVDSSSTYSLSLPQTPAPEVPDPGFESALLHRQLKKAISSNDAGAAFGAFRALERLGRLVNVTETSSLVEQLIRADMMEEAAEVTRGMLTRDTHPLPKIFRFLLNKLAVMGRVETILSIGQYLPTKIKRDVSFDNRLCNAYLSASRGAEFLDQLEKELDVAVGTNDSSTLNIVKDKFPRGGAMGLLDSHPELLERYTSLAQKFAKVDYVAPMNVLWTYHFIHGNKDTAATIWQDYVCTSNQIMFQKVCQVARSTGNVELAFDLVKHLDGADQVTGGARGIAYSCLLDCLTTKGDYKSGWKVLQEAMTFNVSLEDINRTALVRLKQGILDEGGRFPLTIPPKNARKEFERSVSPIDWNEL